MRESHIFGVFLYVAVIASEAKQSTAPRAQLTKYGLLRRFAPRNDEKIGDDRKFRILGLLGSISAESVSDCNDLLPIQARNLSLRTSPERIAAESLTPPRNPFRSPQHLALIIPAGTRSSLSPHLKRRFDDEIL
jgi:hypothetical protein